MSVKEPGGYLSTQSPSLVLMIVSSKVNEMMSKRLAPVRKATRLMKCFRGTPLEG